MIIKNAAILEGLAQSAIEFIHNTYVHYHKKVDIFAVAFSGGKDSLVLLDLVQRTLSPDEFVVVFSDTTMEITPTLESVKKAQKKWNHLSFYTAKSVKDAETTWKEFGPPSRIHRWCCTVHKSAPTLLALREIVGKPSVKALVFDGIRWTESQARAGYNMITDGGKHNTQINASPVIKWNSAEVFLYLFQRDIFLNSAYRYGFVRVGCAVCPLSSKWWDAISYFAFRNDINKFIDILKEYSNKKEIDEKEIEKYINQGGWKGRAGGRDLDIGGNKVLENIDDSMLKFSIRNPYEDWLEWAKSLGKVNKSGHDAGHIEKGQLSVFFKLARHQYGVDIEIKGLNQADRFFISNLRAVNYKTAYCIHCKGCEVECPTGALSIKNTVWIDEKRCIHCAKCLTFEEKGCLSAKSLAVSNKGVNMKGLNRYQHFGMRKEWLIEFFNDTDNWWHQNKLGNRQFEAMRVWLREAEIIHQNRITELGIKLKIFTADSFLTWAVMWTNLSRNSALINWYIKHIEWRSIHTKNTFIELLDKRLSLSSRQNSITSLVEILKHTPLGKDMGLGEIQKAEQRSVSINKRGWDTPHILAVLYSLYRYAEKVETHNLTLGELYTEEAPEGPYVLFGIAKDELANILRGLASRYESWISVELVRDLDNIYLNSSKSALEVLNL